MKRRLVRVYIKNHPICTYKDIRRDIKIKVERIYKNMKHAYQDANAILPKGLTKRIKHNKKEM